MSLINRMLRDLSARERKAGDVLSGISVPGAPPPRRGASPARLVLLLVLVAAFTGVIWLLLPQPAQKPGDVAPIGASAPAPGPAAPAPADRLQLDTTLATVPAGPPAKQRRPAPKPAVTEQEALASAQALAAPPAAKPAEPPKPRARDAKAAAQRYEAARAALARGEETTAAEGFAEALELDPTHRGAREELGKLRLRQGRLGEAEVLLRTGLELEPGWIGYRRLAARIELARNNAAGAAALLERGAPSVEADPEYAGLLASAWQRLERHAEAARAYQQLAQVQPGEPHWWAGYGLSRDALGDAPGALAAYSQARALGGLDPLVLEHINRRSAALTSGG